MQLPNRNQILLLVGLIVAEGPDVSAVAAWLKSSGIPHIAKIVHFLAWLATALGSAALAWPAIRAKLAALGLTTPPGATAPWNPERDAGPAGLPVKTGLPGASQPRVTAPRGTGNGNVPLMLLILGGGLLLSSPARAQAPQLGTCTASGLTCFAPAVAVSVASYNLTTKDIAAGVTPQIGYGLTYHSLIDFGAALYVGATVGQNLPNHMDLTLLFDVANWFRFGPGVTLQQGGQTQALLFIGTGTAIGGSTTYVKAQVKSSQERAVEAAAFSGTSSTEAK